MENSYSLTAHELRKMIAKGRVAGASVIDQLFSRIEKLDGRVKAFVLADKENAKKAAADFPKNGALAGIPVLIKDNICVRDEETTCASRILKGFKPPYDATVVRRLK